ncbi:MAG: amidase [Gemmobacter sp.]|jgi:aspartyl-tRNA(Asn)/glutamyl-tRNA(Gln) amidotransferase subunit A|nr:amidase [Gemmobacter sp.]
MDIVTLSREMAEGRMDALGLTRHCIARIREDNDRLHAVAILRAEEALARAAFLDAERAAGRMRGPLHGIPVLVKELVDIAGIATAHGSLCYGAPVAARNAPLIDRLEAAGAIILGTTHMVEFAMGSWGTNQARGTPLNPRGGGAAWYAGGSSSGSAVAVAAGFAPLAIGSDTGGSIRIPAALCGLYGFKPDHGLIPLDGVAPLAPSFDTIGALGCSIADIRLTCEIMAGQRFAPRRPVSGRLRIAAVPAARLHPCADEVLACYEAVIRRLSALGHEVTEARLPRSLEELQTLNGRIVAYEAYRSFHAQAEDPASPMDPHVRARVLAGAGTSAATHAALLAERAALAADFARDHHEVDAIMLPGAPLPAAGLDTVDETRIPLSRYTRMANCLDLCAVSIPVGTAVSGAPLGLQFCALRGRNGDLLALAERLAPALAGA